MEKTKKNSGFMKFCKNNFSFLALVALCIIAFIVDKRFFTYNVIIGRIQGYVMTGIASLGMTFVILTGGMDLSLGGVACISGFFAAYLSDFAGGALSIIVPIFVGAFVGLINGLLVTKAKAPPFVITLATMSACNGFGLLFNENHALSIENNSNAFYQLANGKFIGVPISVWCFVILVVACICVSRYTKFGRSIYAVGGNEEASRMMGFSPEKVKCLCYIISAAMCGFAGAILASVLGAAQVQAGANWVTTCLAAVVIGGTLLDGGRGSFFGTFCGIMIYSVIEWMLGRMNLLNWWINIITGLILLAVVLVQYRNTRVFAKKKKIKKAEKAEA